MITRSGHPWKRFVDRAAPCLGEHNDHVFLDVLGLSTGEYEAFKSDGLIR